MFGFKLSHLIAGSIAVLVGYTSSIAIIFQAIETLNGTPEQAGSWMLFLGLGMGLTTLFLALRHRSPVMTAWSTPGAALIAVSQGIDMSEAIGASLFCAALLCLTGVTGWFNMLARLIPDALANAMLAGILFGFALKIFPSMKADPMLVGLMVGLYLFGKRAAPRLAIPLVFIAGIVFCAVTGRFGETDVVFSIARPVFVMPSFDWAALIGLGLPLYLVTMSSQNMPGVVVLRNAGYVPPINEGISVTGLASFLTAPFGGYAFNFAAITAALCASEEADEDAVTRYRAAVVAGVLYCFVGLAGTAVIVIFDMLPQAFVFCVAGLALLGAIGNSLSAALQEAPDREAALVTFMTTVSGFSVWGIGAPFWALLFGALTRYILQNRHA